LLRLSGQIVDATVVEARGPRLEGKEKILVKGGGTLESWSKAKAAQIDRDGRWTLKRGRKRPPKGDARVATELVVPAFGCKNHVTIDRPHGVVRRYTVSHTAACDGARLAAVLGPNNTASGVRADTAYRSKEDLAMLAQRGRVERLQRRKPRGKPTAPHIRRDHVKRASVRVAVERILAVQKRRLRPVIRTVDPPQAASPLATPETPVPRPSSPSPTSSPTPGSRPVPRPREDQADPRNPTRLQWQETRACGMPRRFQGPS